MALTPKQQAFINEYMIDLNIEKTLVNRESYLLLSLISLKTLS